MSRRARPWLLAVILLPLLVGCGGRGCGKASGAGGEHGEASEGKLCEHKVLEEICTKCNPKLAPVFQAKGDWCGEHGLPESVCPICHPERGGKPKGKGDHGGEKEHSDEKEHKELPRKVRLKSDVIAEAGIKTAPVVSEILASTIALPGEIVADPDRSARVAPPVAGRLTGVRFKEGAEVKKGDVLATVRVPDIGRVRASLASTQAKAASARSNAERLKALADKGLAAHQEAVAAKSEADALDAEARGLREQLASLGTGSGGSGSDLALRAPVSGVIVSRDAVVGQPVSAEQTIASIADLREVWFLARVFEKDLGKLRGGARAEVLLNAYPEQRFSGSVEQIGRQVDPQARTVTARLRLTNRDDLLRLGLFGTAAVETGDASAQSATLVVPRGALTEIGGKPVVFVRHPDDDFEVHDVVLGRSAPGKVEVVSGLREGEQVVSEGVFTLKSLVLKSTLAEDD